MIRELLRSIDKKEWYFVIGIIAFIILLTSLPYIYGWSQTPAGHIYTGLHSLTPGDVHVYLSYIEQTRQGHWVYEDLYTSDPQARIMFNGFWFLVGLLGKLTDWSNNIVFHTARIILIPLLVIIFYLLASYFWKEVKWRRVCFVFLCFASGVGGMLSIFMPDDAHAGNWYNWPLDLWAPESNNLLTMLQSPHLIASTSLIILILFLFFLSLEKDRLRYSVGAGILSLCLFQFHPFHIPTILVVSGVYVLVQFIRYKKILINYVKHFLVLMMIALPSIFYYFMLERYDFVTQIRTWQNICLTPSWWMIMISYGFILLLAVYGVYKIVRLKGISNRNLFITIWLVVQMVLIYSPFPFQRRMTQGLQISMIILGVMGLRYLYKYLEVKMSKSKFDFWVNNKYLFVILFVLIFTSSNVYNWVREIVVFTGNYPQLYITADKMAGYNWLRQQTGENEVILSDLYNGNLIPGKTGRKVFIGHTVETLFFQSKLNQMNWFYATDQLDYKKQIFLKESNINYVFFSQSEDELGEFEPDDKDYLKKVFEQGDVKIYSIVYDL